MTAPSSSVNVTEEEESKQIIVHKTLSENSSTDISKPERNIVNRTLSQNNSADVSEKTITELKDQKYKESSATKELKRYSNIFDCFRNLLDQLDVMYQRAFMDTPQDEYYTEMLKNLIKVNNHEVEPLSNERLRKAVIDVRE